MNGVYGQYGSYSGPGGEQASVLRSGGNVAYDMAYDATTGKWVDAKQAAQQGKDVVWNQAEGRYDIAVSKAQKKIRETTNKLLWGVGAIGLGVVGLALVSQTRGRRRNPSGIRGKVKRKVGGTTAEVEFDFLLADYVALSATVLGGLGVSAWFEPISTVVGVGLLTGGLGYFGIRYSGVGAATSLVKASTASRKRCGIIRRITGTCPIPNPRPRRKRRKRRRA